MMEWLRKLWAKIRAKLSKSEPLEATFRFMGDGACIGNTERARRFAANMEKTEQFPLAPEHRERFHAIGGDVFVQNRGDKVVVLDSPFFRLLLVPGNVYRVTSPILEPKRDERHRHTMIVEWDAETVIKSLIIGMSSGWRVDAKESELLAESRIKVWPVPASE